ncbi:hypothetical protein [Rhodoferax sp. UBA5149]|uniref:hypothetical protein n=1 Tax=Rhodoferax sp. UBA5149 TaxID=1947379 RepID=UPI0025DCA1B7|nr:hypothetical protein [Rhodoferax sp. UBA5149]
MTLASPSHLVHAYLQSLQKELSRGDATEHTHRSALKALIESAAPGLLATNEPKATQRENKPDYIVRKAASVIGFVEAKDVDKSLKATLKTNQLKRYLEALPNLMLTNYLDFIWFVGGEKRMEISLGSLNGQHVAPAKDASARWDELIACFLAEVSPTVSSPTQLAKNLAGQTRLLRDLSLELLTAGESDLFEQEQSFRALLVTDPSALILDPATGTATFLRKVIALIHQRVDGQHGAGAWPGYVRSQLLPRIFGFELMMGALHGGPPQAGLAVAGVGL